MALYKFLSIYGSPNCTLDFVGVQDGNYALCSCEVPILDTAKYEYSK